MKHLSKLFNFALMLFVIVSIQSCVDTEFDEPDGKLTIPDDKIVSIATLMEKLPGTGSVQLTEEELGTDELYVKGIVTSDDEAGNFFKALYFQDETGGLFIEPDQNELNAAYPRGSIVYVRLLNLYLMRDSNVPKLAYALDGQSSLRLPDAIVSSVVLSGGLTDEVVEPEEVTLAEVSANSSLYFNRLLRIADVEFTSDWLGSTYAIADGIDGPETVNTTIKDCGNAEIILRNSGYSNFAGHLVPGGNGSLTCILNKFSDDLQLFVRDTDDLQFTADRCDGSTGSVDFPDNELDLAIIKNDFISQGVDKIPEGFITGIVISDKDQQNITNRNLILQSGATGVILRFNDAHNYSLGSELKVNVSGQSFSEFNGGTQIDGMGPVLIEVQGSTDLPEPVKTTIGEINSDPYKYESIRVLVEGATISGAAYDFNITFSDASGSIVSFIQSFATFNGLPTPTGSVDVVGYGSYYNEPQLLINGPSDITGGSGTGGGDFPTNELDLADIKGKYLDQGIDGIEDGFISGVVISDAAQGNITNRNLILQNGDAGIILRFAATHDYQLGEQIKVNVSGKVFSEFNGGTQIDGFVPTQIERDGNASLPTPVKVTVSELTSDPYEYESIRILIEGATIAESTYEFNININDGTGSVVSFVQTFATFNGQAIPTGELDIVAYGSYYNEPQVIINGPSDVTGGGMTGGPGDGDVNQNFDGKTDFDAVDYEGWMNVTAVGNEPWYFRSFDNNGFAECEAFQSDDAVVESWLITPAIDTDDKSIITFQTAQAFWQHQGLSVWVSPDFDNVSDANWIELTSARIANSSDEQYTFIDSGDIQLKDFGSGTVRVGWKYEGTSAANTTKMRIDNVVLK